MVEIRTIRPTGPKAQPKLAIIGDYPNDDELRLGLPFVGRDEKVFRILLEQAGLARRDCYLTTVFKEKPVMPDMSDWTHTKTELKAMGLKTSAPPIAKGRYLHPDRFRALGELREELEAVRPNIVLALGSVPLWALTTETSIMKNRGSVLMSNLVEGQKVLSTYEPYKLIKQWELYPIISVDYQKAAKLSHTRENIIPSRQIWIRPTLDDMEQYWEEHLSREDGPIAVDIETQQKQITCIGFASSSTSAIVVPFWNTKQRWEAGSDVFHYWKTPEEEVRAMQFCKRVLDHRRPKVFQNGMYDLTYLWKVWGMPTRNPQHDTMLLHHSIQPELLKGLGFLGSVYTMEPSWKHMRKTAMDTEKRDE